MTDSADRLHRRIYLLTAGLLYAAAVLRTALELGGDPLLTEALLLLLAWLVLFVVETLVDARWGAASQPGKAAPATQTPGRRRTSSWGPFFPLYLAAQSAIVVVLLARSQNGDYYSVLFGILSMQAMLRLGWKTAVIWVALFIPLTGLPLTLAYDVPQAIAFACMYAAVDGFLAFFAFVTRRAGEARARNRTLMGELQTANREIEAYSRQVERLAATGERHRLARELHDSVTQTVFSMNLTAQSAALLMPRDHSAASSQLARLEELAQGALAEIGLLGSELAPAELGEGGLVAALRRHLADHGFLVEGKAPGGAAGEAGPPGGPPDAPTSCPPGGLTVSLTVEGAREPEAVAVGGAPERAASAPPGAAVQVPAQAAASAPLDAAVQAPDRPQGVLSPAEELDLFRIAQEALNNVVKHAETSEAAIRLRLSPPRRLEIEDHGCGFSPVTTESGQPAPGRGREATAQPGEHGRSATSPALEDGGGMGLASMRERAAEIGWSLRVVSAPGEGTRVVVEQSEQRAVGYGDERAEGCREERAEG